MKDPVTGAEIPQGTPAPANAPGQGQATPPAQGGAAGQAPDNQPKTVPITALHEERDKRQAQEAANAELRAEIDALRQQIQPQQYQPVYQPQPQQYQPYPQPPPNIKEQIDALWDQDVRKGFQAEMMAMMQYRDWVDTKVDSGFEATRSRHNDDFGRYEPKIRSYVRSLPIDARAQDNIVEAAYLMVKGQDTPNILKLKEEELAKKYQSQYGAIGLGGTFNIPQRPEGSATLSPEERVAAQAMGLSEEDYLKYRGTP